MRSFPRSRRSSDGILGHSITESDDWFLIELKDGSELVATGEHRIYLSELNSQNNYITLSKKIVTFQKNYKKHKRFTVEKYV